MLQIDYFADVYCKAPEMIYHSTPSRCTGTDAEELLSPVFNNSPKKKSETSTIGDLVKDFVFAFQNAMTKRLKWQLLRYIYRNLVIEEGGIQLATFVQPDFLNVSVSAMQTLLAGNKHNLIYDLGICFQRRGADTTETRMPLQRMPFGLVDYNIRFFASQFSQKIGIEDRYVQWLETMFTHFGHKWLCLHRGPFWQYDVEEQPDPDAASDANTLPPDSMESNGDHLDCTCPAKMDTVCKESTNSIIADALADLHIDLDEFESPVRFDESDISIGKESMQSFYLILSQQKSSSILWDCLSKEQNREVLEGGTSPEVMEHFHRIQPSNLKRKPVNSGIYDPMKVMDDDNELNEGILCVHFMYSTLEPFNAQECL